MSRNYLVSFEKKDVEILVLDEQILFNPYDVAECLGIVDVKSSIRKFNKNQVITVKNSDVHDMHFRKIANRGENFLTESGLYKLIFKSNKPEAEAFQDWVTDEVLPEIRKKGHYIDESATDESLDFDRIYGKRRVRKSIRESQDVRKLFEDFINLSAKEREAKRLTNKDRINTLNIFADELENKLANEAINMRGSELLATQELLTDIHKEKNRLSNKANGGLKSAMTKQIAQLTEENEQLKSQNLYEEDEDGFFFIDKHPFSCNYQYSYSSDGVVKSAAYHRWINNLHLEQFLPSELPNVDLTKPLSVTLLYGHKEGMDTPNFSKSIIDQLAEYWQFNDSLVTEVIQSLHSYVESYNDGYMYVKIENIND